VTRIWFTTAFFPL